MGKKVYQPGIGFVIYEGFILFMSLSALVIEFDLFLALFSFMTYTTIGFVISYNLWKRKMKLENMTSEEREALQIEKQIKKEDQMKRLEEASKKTTISRVVMLDTVHNKKSKGSLSSAAIRGAVGATVAGPLGMVVGGATAKRKTIEKGGKTKFLIEYEDGHKVVKEVKIDSAEYKKLVKYL